MVFIKHRRWVIGMVLVLGIMLFNFPITPKSGEVLSNGNVAFEWIGQANYASVDDNKMFSSPVIVNKGAMIELKPGEYYWRVSGFGIVNRCEIKSVLGVEIWEHNGDFNINNAGSEDVEIHVRSSGVLTGLFVLEEDEEKRIGSKMKDAWFVAMGAEDE